MPAVNQQGIKIMKSNSIESGQQTSEAIQETPKTLLELYNEISAKGRLVDFNTQAKKIVATDLDPSKKAEALQKLAERLFFDR